MRVRYDQVPNGVPAASGATIPWGAIVGALGGFAGDYLGYRGQQETNAANARQAQAAMDFERDMSNTAYQRARADITAAGYNPALAYSKGGADTPSGKTAQMENSLAAFGGTAQRAADTFNSIRATTATINQQEANAKKTEAETNQLNLESAARLAQLQAGAKLTATDAKFAEETYPLRRTMLASDYGQKQTANLRALEELYQFQDLRPLTVEHLKQQIRSTMAGTRDTEARATLHELERPTAENTARAANTLWGRNVKPYLGDAATIANALSIGAGTFALRNLFGPKGPKDGAIPNKDMSSIFKDLDIDPDEWFLDAAGKLHRRKK